MLFVIYNAELPGCHAMDGAFGMNGETAIERFYSCRQVIGGMANLKSYLFGQGRSCLGSEEMEVTDSKILPVGCLWIVALGDIEDIMLYIFLHSKPWSNAETQAMTLADGVEP